MNAPVLQVESLHKSYGALQATNNVSLDVRPGEIHALIGPNGRQDNAGASDLRVGIF